MPPKEDSNTSELERAESELRRGAFEKAQEILERLVDDDSSGRARFGLAQCACDRGEFHRALAHLQSVEELAPELPRLNYSMGVALFGIGLSEQAQKQLELAVEDDPKDARAWFELARVHESRGAHQPCLAACKATLKLDPDQPLARSMAKTALEALGRANGPGAAGPSEPPPPRDPIRPRDASSEKPPRRAGASEATKSQQGNPAPAAKEPETPEAPPSPRKARPARSPRPALPAAHVARELARADEALRDGRIDEAEKLFDRHLDSSESTRARIGWARCMSQQGHQHQALSALQEVESSSPNHPELAAAMAAVFYRLGCYPEARAKFEQAIALNREDELLWSDYTAFLRSTGDFQGAVEACRRILNKPTSESPSQGRPNGRRAGRAKKASSIPQLDGPARKRRSPSERSSKSLAKQPRADERTRQEPTRSRDEAAHDAPFGAGRYNLAIGGMAGALTGSVAFFMNKVMSTIMGRASVLEAELEGDEQHHQDLREILEACSSGRSVTGELLRLVRAGKAIDEAVSIEQLLDNVTALVTASAPRSIAVHADLGRRAYRTRGDSSQLTHALRGICENAIEAMPKGGTLTIQVGHETHGDSADDAGEERDGQRVVTIRVTDTGTGIAPKVLERCLEPFFTTRTGPAGRGLGLPLAHGTVVNHGGSLAIESEEGTGTTVIIRLPAVAQTTKSRSLGKALPMSGRPLVLLADDDRSMRTTGRRLLESMGYRVLVASGGHEAVELFEGNQAEISVVLLDRVMPDMDGTEACRRILRIRSNARVLLASGYGAGTDVGELLAHGSGCVGFLQKPFAREELVRAVTKALGDA